MVKIQEEPCFPHFSCIFHPLLYLTQIMTWLQYWYHNVLTGHVGHPCLIRSTGEIIREQMPLTKRLRVLILFSKPFEWIDRTQVLRSHLHHQADSEGKYENSPESKKDIAPFIRQYQIDMSAFTPSDPEKYTCFNDFFMRAHKEESRPLDSPNDDSVVVSAADCRLVVYDSVRLTKHFWIKGHNFSIASLLGGDEDAHRLSKKWDEGGVSVFRLSPQDYHRYHSPVSGEVKWIRHVPGNYYGVDPAAVNSDISVLDTNARTALVISTEKFGDVLFVAIGAQEVGSVRVDLSIGDRLRRGDEVGRFAFGGSSIIIAFEKGKIIWDDDLREGSLLGLMIDVKVRERIGKLIP